MTAPADNRLYRCSCHAMERPRLFLPELEQGLDRHLQDPGDPFQVIESGPEDPALHVTDGFHRDPNPIRELLLGESRPSAQLHQALSELDCESPCKAPRG